MDTKPRARKQFEPCDSSVCTNDSEAAALELKAKKKLAVAQHQKKRETSTKSKKKAVVQGLKKGKKSTKKDDMNVDDLLDNNAETSASGMNYVSQTIPEYKDKKSTKKTAS